MTINPLRNPELLPFTINLLMTANFGIKALSTGEWGKLLYWLGATVLTAGLMLMKG